MQSIKNQKTAVIGSGAAGLSSAWLLSLSHNVTLFEKDDRLGGHAHTARVDTGSGDPALAIDTGFIVYNEKTYPNLTAWLQQLGVLSHASDMSFAVSRDNGRFEYKGGTLLDLVAQPSNLLKLRFYQMLRDLLRFYRTHADAELPPAELTLGQLLQRGRYSKAFINDHLLPFAAAIWSTSPAIMLDYPAAAFIRFCANHALLDLSGRPQWRSIVGGSQSYVNAVSRVLGEEHIKTSVKISRVTRQGDGITIETRGGATERFDHVVFACHADQALEMLHDADAIERDLLSPFKYQQNLAMLHTDASLMPRRRRAWASWNYVDNDGQFDKTTVSYWMNSLQNLQTDTDYIVSLNPTVLPRSDSILRTTVYQHPLFNQQTFKAQHSLWSLQGRRNTWFCGAYFGSGFHEDAIQSGLAVAEQLGSVPRPWSIENESGRIHVGAVTCTQARADQAVA